MSSDGVVQAIVNKISLYEPQKVILFGSAVRGDWRENSDIDLAIIKDTGLPFYKRAVEVRKILRSKTPLDIFVFTPREFEDAKMHNELVAEINKTGRVIYGAA